MILLHIYLLNAIFFNNKQMILRGASVLLKKKTGGESDEKIAPDDET